MFVTFLLFLLAPELYFIKKSCSKAAFFISSPEVYSQFLQIHLPRPSCFQDLHL